VQVEYALFHIRLVHPKTVSFNSYPHLVPQTFDFNSYLKHILVMQQKKILVIKISSTFNEHIKIK